jgi:hypothetical protein
MDDSKEQKLISFTIIIIILFFFLFFFQAFTNFAQTLKPEAG